MIRVLLSDKGQATPHQWWWKFLHGTDNYKRTTPLTTEERIDVINLELLNWSAQLWDRSQKDASYAYQSAYIDFYDEQAYSWFLLRWA
jgi:hypothetical protein